MTTRKRPNSLSSRQSTAERRSYVLLIVRWFPNRVLSSVHQMDEVIACRRLFVFMKLVVRRF